MGNNDNVIKWKHFGVNGALCGEITNYREIPSQRQVTRSLDVFFDPRQLSKQSIRRWFETLLRSLWRQCNYVYISLGVLYLCLPSMFCNLWLNCYINTLRPKQNSRHFADDIFKFIFFVRGTVDKNWGRRPRNLSLLRHDGHFCSHGMKDYDQIIL